MWVVPTIPKGVWELQRLQQLQLIHFFWIFLTLFLPSCFSFFFFSDFWLLILSVWIPALTTLSQLSEPFFFSPSHLSVCSQTSPLLSPFPHAVLLFISAMSFEIFSSPSNKAFQNSGCHFEASFRLTVWWAALGTYHTQIRGNVGSD